MRRTLMYPTLALAVATALGTTAAMASPGDDGRTGETTIAATEDGMMIARGNGGGDSRMRKGMESGADKARGDAERMRDRDRYEDDPDRDRDRDRDRDDQDHEPDRDRDRDRDRDPGSFDED